MSGRSVTRVDGECRIILSTVTLIRTQNRPATWGSVTRLALTALAVLAVVSLVFWFLVDDESSVSDSGIWTWSNDDFYQWLALSVASAGLLVVAAGVLTRRWWATAAVTAGCLLALLSGLAVFIGYAAFHSA